MYLYTYGTNCVLLYFIVHPVHNAIGRDLNGQFDSIIMSWYNRMGWTVAYGRSEWTLGFRHTVHPVHGTIG